MDLTLDFVSLLNTTAALFIMLSVGFIAGKIKIINDTASKNLSRLVITIAQPALIIYSVVKMKYSIDNLKLGALTLLFSLALLSFSALISYVCFIKVRNIDERGLMEFSSTFANVGFIGIPILQSFMGDVGGFMASFFIIGFNVMLWTWGIFILSRGRSDIKLTLKKALLNYGTVPGAIGFALFAFPAAVPSFEIPSFTLTALSYISSLCTPISMLIIGARLSTVTLKQAILTPKIYYMCFVKLIVIPLIVCALMKFVGFGDMWVIFATIISAMPSATTVTMLSELYDMSPEFSARGVGISTLLSVATLPLITFVATLII